MRGLCRRASEKRSYGEPMLHELVYFGMVPDNFSRGWLLITSGAPQRGKDAYPHPG
jgi:hypothetical protein